MEHRFDGSADLMMNTVGALVIMLAVFMPLAKLEQALDEQLTTLDNSSGSLEQPAGDGSGAELALLEIGLEADGKTLAIHWRGAGMEQAETLADFGALQNRLEAERPAKVRLRMDRKVPSGPYQDLNVEARRLKFTIIQSNRRKD